MTRISSALLAASALFGSAHLPAHDGLATPHSITVVAESAWLGIYLSGDSSRPKVSEVVPGSPAEKAGVKAGDVFLAVNGKQCKSVDDLIGMMRKFEAGAKVKLRLARGDKKLTLTAVLGKRPGADAPKARSKAKASKKAKTSKRRGRAPEPMVEVEEIEEEAVPPYLGLALDETKAGLVVAEVLKGSPAAKAGIRAGDRITEIADKELKDLDDLDKIMDRLAAGQKVEIEYVRKGKEKDTKLRLGVRPHRAAPSRPSAKAKSRPSSRPTRPHRPAKTSSKPMRMPKKVSVGLQPSAVHGIATKSHRVAATSAGWGHDLKKAMKASQKSGKPVLLVFGADWCVNCHALKKSFAENSVKRQVANYEAVWLDAEKESKLASRFGVQGLPHITILVGGKRVKTMTGYYPAEHLLKSLSEHKPAPRRVRISRGTKVGSAAGRRHGVPTAAVKKAGKRAVLRPSTSDRPMTVRRPGSVSRSGSTRKLEQELRGLRAEMRKVNKELRSIEKLRRELRQLRGVHKELAEIKKLLKDMAGAKKHN